MAGFVAIGASIFVGPASGEPRPEGWRRESAPGIAGIGTWSVALPPAMQTVPVTGIGSYVAEYRSADLTLLFDFGAHAGTAPPNCRGKARCITGSLDVHGGRARRVLYYRADPDGGLPYRAAYEIAFGTRRGQMPRRIILAIGAECASVAACRLADRIVSTIEIRPDR